MMMTIDRICYKLGEDLVEVTSPDELIGLNPPKLFVKQLPTAQ